MKHLAIVKASIAEAILDGKKTCESRLSINPHPARLAQVGDQIYIKVTGGDVVATATVNRIEHWDGLKSADIECLEQIYAPFVNGKNADMAKGYWQSKSRSRFATFLWLCDIRPCHISKSQCPRSCGQAWFANFQLPE